MIYGIGLAAGSDLVTGGASSGELQRERDKFCDFLDTAHADGSMPDDEYAKRKSNAHCGDKVTAEIGGAAQKGALEGAADGAVMAADNYTYGLIPGLHDKAECIRKEHAGDPFYEYGDMASKLSRDAAAMAATSAVLAGMSSCSNPVVTGIARAVNAYFAASSLVNGADRLGTGIGRVMEGDSGGWWDIGFGLVDIGMGIAGARTKSGECFVGGTVVATPSGPVPIESLRVGDRVLTQELTAGGTAVDPATWRLVALLAPDADGDAKYDVRITTLKPVWWIEAVGAKAGAWIEYGIPELRVEGPVLVVDVRPCPPIKVGPGRVVLSPCAQ